MRASLAPSTLKAAKVARPQIEMPGKSTTKSGDKAAGKVSKKRSVATEDEATTPSQSGRAKRGRAKPTARPEFEDILALNVDDEELVDEVLEEAEVAAMGGALLFSPSDAQNLTSNSEDEGEPNFRRRGPIATTPTPPAESPTQLDESFVEEEEEEGEGEGEDQQGVADEAEEEDLNRPLPEYWEYPTEVTLDRLELYTDEVAQMVKTVGKTKLIQALFSMSCMLVFDFVSAQMRTMTVVDLATSCTDAFKTHLENFPKKGYARDKLLHLFPNGTWPAAYMDFVNTQMNMPPTAKALASTTYNGVAPAKYRAVRFGLAVKSRYNDTKAFVNMNLFPNYTPEEKLKSGHTKEQLLRAIRASLWPLEAHTKAHNGMRAAASRRKKNGQPEPTQEAWDAAFELARAKAFRKFNNSYYPQEFLAFLLFSAPAEVPAEILPSLNGGNGGIDALVDPTGTAEELADDADGVAVRSGRDARRARLVAAANGGRGAGRGAGRGEVALAAGRGGRGGRGGAGGAAGQPAPPNHLEVTHRVVVEASSLDKRITALDRLIVLARGKTNITEEAKQVRIEELQHQLEVLLEQQALAPN